ncbi:MAG: hypothetical protein WCR49_13925 [Opitutae bacterium]
MKHLVTLLLFSALFGLTGCQSVDDRIKQKPDVFAAVDKATQDKIKQGIIDLGYTPDMVYLALGAPDQKRETVAATGMSISWIYNTYYQRYDGTAFVGYERRVYYDPGIRSYRLYYHPAYIDTYHEERDERIRVVFKDGKAAVIEQSKD